MNNREIRLLSYLLADRVYDRLDWDDLDLVWDPDYCGLEQMVDVCIQPEEIIITLRPEDGKVFLITFPVNTPAEVIIESVALQVIFS